MLGKVVYWLAVVVISLALVIALILFLESRDRPEVNSGHVASPTAGARP